MKQNQRPSASSRGYNRRWRTARQTYLSQHPLCLVCGRHGRVRAASVVDHIIPHKGDSTLFWDSANWQPLCKPCHDGYKQAIERGGTHAYGCDPDGLPADPNHPWNVGLIEKL